MTTDLAPAEKCERSSCHENVSRTGDQLFCQPASSMDNTAIRSPRTASMSPTSESMSSLCGSRRAHLPP